MKKTVKKVKVENVTLDPKDYFMPILEVKEIHPVTADFGRADLNHLRDVVNELVARS